ncbi:MAG: hypothetical protein C4340_00925, partial [Armatimonadota bacterium]
ERALPPFFFFGNPHNEEALKLTLAQVEKASSAGVHLYSMMVEFRADEEGAQTALDATVFLLERISEVDAEARVMFRLVFAPPEG